MSFLDTLYHAVVEEDQSGVLKRVVDEPDPAPLPASPLPEAVDVRGSSLYQTLLSKTDFSQTPVAQAVQRYLDPIASLAVDTATKFKMAFMQAQAHDNLSPEAIFQAHDSMLKTLDEEAAAFKTATESAIATGVTSAQADAAKMQETITGLQQRMQELTQQAYEISQKIGARTHEFETAFRTRRAELNEQRSKYAALLQ